MLKTADRALEKPRYKSKKSRTDVRDFGATDRNRTGDLILTKDVLYQLSHSSTLFAIVL